MDTDRQARVEQIVASALKCKTSDRASFVKQACGGDQDLLNAVLTRIPQLGSLPSTQTFFPSLNESAAPADTLPPLIGQTLGSYQILSQLGRGGMGEVYLALDAVLERKVALKLLPAEFTSDRNRIRRFEHEAKAASALNHPNIVSIYGMGDSEFGQYIVMEWIEGQSLRSMQPLPLAPGTVRDIALQAAKALEISHAAGVIHRDIKPDNIMVRQDGLVKVLDFGLARLVGPMSDLADTSGMTASGAIIGSVRYMSPEQARGEWLTAASDIFSLGIVLYELATGRHPFEAESAVGYLHAIVSRPAIPPSRLNPEVPGWFEALLLRMLDKDPASRCRAAELAAACQVQDSVSAIETPKPPASARTAVARKRERAELDSAFRLALEGRSCMVCISGEPGQGKTTLAEEFLAGMVHTDSALVARGRCSERLSGSEAYLPILETLDSLMNGVEREMVVAAMKSRAPTWYAQLTPGSSAVGAAGPPSQEKLKRELAALLQELSRRQPLVIFLDDVHWADMSTVDLLSYLGVRLDGMRVLLLVTYRAPELHSSNQQFLALQLELQSRGFCQEIALGFFSLEQIRDYLELRFPGHGFPAEFAHGIHLRTEGNPLFVADLLSYLQERGAIVRQNDCWMLNGSLAEMLNGLPESVRSLVQRKMEQFGEGERRVLMAASIQGTDFDTAVVARALDADPADIEEGLERIERQSGFVKLVAEHEYPDRSLTLRYSFVHVLYQNAFFAALRPTRRVALSKAVAEALLQFHGAQAGRIAAQLAFLFDTARDFARAAVQYQIAAQNALSLFANKEAEALARRGLDAMAATPESAERTRLELNLHSVLAPAIRDQKTHASSESQETHRRVRELSQETGDTRSAFFAQVGLFWSALVTSDFRRAREEMQQCTLNADQMGDIGLIIQAHLLGGYLGFHTANYAESERRLRGALALYDPEKHVKMVETFGLDARVNGMGLLGLNRWFLGFPDQAKALLQEGIEIARTLPYPLPLASSLVPKMFLLNFLGEYDTAGEAAAELIALSEKHGLQNNTMFWGKFGAGWASARKGSLADGKSLMCAAIGDGEAMGMVYCLPTFGLALAEVAAQHGEIEEALGLIDQYLPAVEQSGPREKMPEFYRLKGELLLTRGLDAKAESLFQLALRISQESGARSLELRAATSMAQLLRKKGDTGAARQVLSDVYDWFTEGFDTADLKAARALLEELSQETDAASV